MATKRWMAGPGLLIALGTVAQQASAAIIGDPGGSGPWPAVAESRTELPLHTVYRPQRWPDAPVPLYVWGNGGCSANGLSHAAYLREIASQGYVVVALGVANASAAAGRGAGPAPAQPAGDPTTPAQMIEAIEWATRENARADGEFRNRIDLTRIAVGGHSCGGLQAIAVSHDPRIDTTLVLNSGVYIRPGGRSQVAVDKTQLTRLHGPMLYLTGGPGDVAHENAVDDFAKIDSVPVFIGSLGVGHGGTFSQPNGGEWAHVTVRWLNWNLKADADASRDFSGASCRLCTDARWTIQQKRLAPPAGQLRQ
jgi:predicted alpha/beta-hydrolase family hydrolase